MADAARELMNCFIEPQMRVLAKKIDDQIMAAMCAPGPTFVPDVGFRFNGMTDYLGFTCINKPETQPMMSKTEFAGHLTALVADAAAAQTAKSSLVVEQRRSAEERQLAVRAIANKEMAEAQQDAAQREVASLKERNAALEVTNHRLGELLRRAATPTYYTMFPR